MDFKRIFDNLVIKCICTGDQELWNHLYPYIKECGYEIDKNILAHFSYVIDKNIRENFPTEISVKDIDNIMNK